MNSDNIVIKQNRHVTRRWIGTADISNYRRNGQERPQEATEEQFLSAETLKFNQADGVIKNMTSLEGVSKPC